MDIEFMFWVGIFIGALVYTFTGNHILGMSVTGAAYAIWLLGLYIYCKIEDRK